jgi:hypothetical protein
MAASPSSCVAAGVAAQALSVEVAGSVIVANDKQPARRMRNKGAPLRARPAISGFLFIKKVSCSGSFGGLKTVFNY